MDRFSDMDGVVPWIPSELEDVYKEVWADGLRFESQFYDLDREQMLGDFAERVLVHTPLDWLVRYMAMMPDVIQKQVMEAEIVVIFSVIGAAGSLSHHRPSTVAAAVLALILDDQAEPYLCGYDLMDVETALAEIRMLLDCV